MAACSPARLLGLFLALASVAATARAVAYFATTHQRQPSVDKRATGLDSLREMATSTSQPARKPLTRFADAADTWLESLHNPSFWRKNRDGVGSSRGQARPRGRSSRERSSRERTSRERIRPEQIRPERASPSRATLETVEPRHDVLRYYSTPRHDGATYRTMCVRLCDGYYWPISFSATKGDLARDSAACERSCDSPAMLHVYRNPGEEPEDMVDLKGNPYVQLLTAFRYRASYDAACKCRPHPWEDGSRRRHANYRQSGEAQTSSPKKP